MEDSAEMVKFWIDQIRLCEDDFFRRCGIKIRYDDSAVDKLLDACRYDETSLFTHCERLGNIFEYGFGIIKDRTGVDSFTIDVEAVKNPEGFINRLLREYYSSER
jgi:hypothetical protein